MGSISIRLLALTLPIVVTACTSEPAETPGGATAADTCEAPTTTPLETTWAKSYASDAPYYGTLTQVSAAAIDDEGDLVLGGAYSGNLALGDDTLPGAGSRNGFLLGYAPSGARIWELGFPGTTIARVLPVATGGLVVVGSFDGVVDFGGGSLDAGLVAAGFVLRLDASGHHVWSRAIGGGAASVTASDAALTPEGVIVVAGAFAGAVDFGAGPESSGGGPNDGFVVAYDAQGNFLWDDVFGPSGEPSPSAPDTVMARVAVDDIGRIVLLGRSDTVVVMDEGSYFTDSHAFLVGLDRAGTQRWQRAFAARQDTAVYAEVLPSAIAAAPGGDVVVGGTLWGTTDLWNVPTEPPAESVHQAFLVRLSAGGEPRWTAEYALSPEASQDEEQITAIAADRCALTVAGSARAIDFGGGPLGSNAFATSFVAELDPQAHFQRGATFANAYGVVSALAVGRDHVVVGGAFEGRLDLPGTTIDSGGAPQAFAAVLGP